MDVDSPLVSSQVIDYEEFKRQRLSFSTSTKKQVQIISEGSHTSDELQMQQQLHQRSLTITSLQQKSILKQNSIMNRPGKNSYAQRRTNTTTDREIVRERVQTQYIKIRLRQEEQVRFADLNSPEAYDKFLLSLFYRDLRLMGRGTTTITFKAINSQNQIVAVKVQQKSEGSLQAALLYKSINQDMANNLIGHTLFQHQIIEVGDILVIEEDLANETLEDVLIQRAQKGQNFSDEEIRQIIEDITEQLYLLHVIKGCVHNDIKPENILVIGKQYILHDFGVAEQANIQQILSNEKQEIQEITGTILYMSPIKKDHYNYCLSNNYLQGPEDVFQSQLKKLAISQVTYNKRILNIDEKFYHNQFKSDIYSFGLVLMRLILHNNNINMMISIENIFYENRDHLEKMIQKYPYYFHKERFVLFNGHIREIRSLLEIMLEPEEENRINIIELALMLNTGKNILRSIITPHPRTFQPQVEYMLDYTRVIYEVKKLIYEGDYDDESQQKSGMGCIFQVEDQFWAKSRFQNSLSPNQRKNQTIKEEDASFEMSVLDLKPSSANPNMSIIERKKTMMLHSRLKDTIPLEYTEKTPLYEGSWSRDLPHGQGELRIYSTKSNSDYESLRGHKHPGMIIKQKSKSAGDMVNLTLLIRSEFVVGMLNGQTQIQVQNNNDKCSGNSNIIEKSFVLNMTDSALCRLNLIKLGFGIYTFIEEQMSQSVLGYFETDMIYSDGRCFVFDLVDVPIQKVEEVLRSLFGAISFKLQTIQYSQDKIRGSGVLILKGKLSDDIAHIHILFAESPQAKRPRSRASQPNPQGLVKKKKTQGCCYNCFSKQKQGSQNFKSEEVITKLNTSNPVDLIDKDQILSIVLDTTLSLLSIIELESIDLGYSILKRQALNKLESENIKQFTKVQSLNLNQAVIQDIKQIDDIIMGQRATYLKQLNLSYQNITDSTLDCIINSESLNKLQKLSLRSCRRLTQVGMIKLLSCEKMIKLITLDISENDWIDGQLLNTLEFSQLKSLQELLIAGCTNIPLEAMNKFLKSDLVRRLFYLSMRDYQPSFKQTKKGKIIKLAIEEFEQILNINKLNLSNIRMLSFDNLKTIKSLIDRRLRNINLTYAFRELYNITVESIFELFELNLPHEYSIKSHEYSDKSGMKSAGKSGTRYFEDFTHLECFLIDVRLQKYSLQVCMDLSKMQASFDQTFQNLQIQEVEILDVSESIFDSSCLQNVMSLLTMANVVQLRVRITDSELTDKKTTKFLVDFSNQALISQSFIRKVVLHFHKSCDMNTISSFIQEFVHIFYFSVNTQCLEVILPFSLPQPLWLYFRQLKSLTYLTVNNQNMELNYDIWDGQISNMNSQLYLKYKIDMLCENHSNPVEDPVRCSLNPDSEWLHQIRDENLRQLAEADGLQQLERLRFCHQQLLTDKGIEYVLKSQNTIFVQLIDLSYTNITGEVFRLITNSSHLQNLKHLILIECNKIMHEDFAQFVHYPAAQNLRTFELTSTNINTIDQFFMMKRLKNLEKIKIVFLHEVEDVLSSSSMSSKDSLKTMDREDLVGLYCLHLDFSRVNCARIPQILSTLRNPNLLKVLVDLSRKNQIDEYIEAIFENLKGLNQSMQEFSLNISSTTFTIDNKLSNWLIDFFTKNYAMSYFNFTWNRLTDTCPRFIEGDNMLIQQLSQHLGRMNGLRYLELSLEKQFFPTRQTMQLLFSQLKKLCILLEFKLNLKHCYNIESKDFEGLGRTIQSWHELQKFNLQLSYTNINDDEVAQILETINKSETQGRQLRKVILNLEGCQHIGKVFKDFVKKSKRTLSGSNSNVIRQPIFVNLCLKKYLCFLRAQFQCKSEGYLSFVSVEIYQC